MKTDNTSLEELRKQINTIKDRLAGRNRTHQEVARRSGWSSSELEQVIKEDNWIYEDEMLALITRARLAELESIAIYHGHYKRSMLVDKRITELQNQLNNKENK